LGVGDVLKTPKNLVYDFLSSKGSLKQVIEFDQYILSNKGLFLKKKICAYDGMFNFKIEMSESSTSANMVSSLYTHIIRLRISSFLVMSCKVKSIITVNKQVFYLFLFIYIYIYIYYHVQFVIF